MGGGLKRRLAFVGTIHKKKAGRRSGELEPIGLVIKFRRRDDEIRYLTQGLIKTSGRLEKQKLE